MDLKATLQTRFGFSAFREGQEAAIRAALEGKRVLLIQPTGWGKSLVYQMIAAMRGLTQPQKDFTNAAQKAENLKGAFECAAPVQGKTLLVVDDVYDSGATLKEAGRILKQAGAGRLYAFCIARTRHRGDL